MAIVGIGTDVVGVERLNGLIDRRGRRFLERWFRPAEVDFCLVAARGSRHAAALLAAKEATFKSLHVSGAGPIPWRDIEITHRGQVPGVCLHGVMRDLAASGGVSAFHVSMSDNPYYAVATVVAVSESVHDSV